MDQKNNKPNNSRIPENDPSKAMDSKKEVEKSNDNKIDQDFPGYPHYPANEDMMDKRTDNHRVDIDVENLPNNRNATGVSERFMARQGSENEGSESPVQGAAGRNTESIRGVGEGDELEIKMGTEADVDGDELKALSDDDYLPTADEDRLRGAALDNTDFDGEELNEVGFGLGRAQSDTDLDMNTSPDETASDALGQGDEENKYYSLGGDRHENLDEDRSSISGI